MSDFIKYYGRHKVQNNHVAQATVHNVPQNKTKILKFRVSDSLLEKIEDKCIEKNRNFSELNRILWEAYFEVEKNLAWKKEIAEWDKPRLKRAI